jgi:hypothetical protein
MTTEVDAAHLAGQPHESHDARDAHDSHEALSFREQVRERVIAIGSMDGRLRLVVGAAVAQLVVAAIMLALRGTHLPSVIGDVTGDEESSIPVATFVIATCFLTVAWAFLLAGAFHAHWVLRLPAFGLFAWVFAIESDTVSGRTGGTVAALALMVAIAAVGIAGAVRDRRQQPSRRLGALRVLLLIPLVGGLYITAWLASASTDDTENFTTAVAQQLYYLEFALIPALVLAGADFADWGHLLGLRATAALRGARRVWPVLLVTVAVAVAMLVDARRVLADDFGAEVALGAILVAAVVLLAVAVRPRGSWSPHVPFAALIAVVVVDATEGFLVERFVGGSDDSISDHIYAVSAVLWAAVALVAIGALVARRGRMRSRLANALAFLVLVGVSNALFGISSVAAVFPQLHISADVTALDLDGVRGVAAIATLALVAGVVLSRRLRASGRLLGTLLALDVGLQVLAWVDALFDRTASVAETVTRGFSIMAGVVLLLALLLEILGSGEAITNRHDRWLPRPSRVLLYLGYVVLVASAVLYFNSLHDPQSFALREAQFDSESWVHEGVFFLGVPLVATLFLANLGSGRRPDRALTAAATAEQAA